MIGAVHGHSNFNYCGNYAPRSSWLADADLPRGSPSAIGVPGMERKVREMADHYPRHEWPSALPQLYYYASRKERSYCISRYTLQSTGRFHDSTQGSPPLRDLFFFNLETKSSGTEAHFMVPETPTMCFEYIGLEPYCGTVCMGLY